jgi:GntR family transcriptional repressor for pyruvate dehydrogenase complex
MAAKLGVGRPAVREAIKALVSLDILESRRGDGTYLRSGLLSGASSIPPANSQSDVIELLELRKMIEPRAAALAAARATSRQLSRIEKELAAQEKNLGDLRKFAAHDYGFHHEILSAAGNRLLSGVEASLAPLLHKSRDITIHTAPSLEAVSRQHWAIFTAIKLGEPQFAERAMTEHLQSMGIDLISGMRR